MPDLDAFLRRCETFAEQRRWRRSTLSTRLFNDGGRLDQLVAGGDVGVRRLARAVDDLTKLEEGLSPEVEGAA